MENLKSLEGKMVRVFEATYNHSSFAAPICIAGKCTLVDDVNGWIVLDDDKVFNLKFLNRIEVVNESDKKKKKSANKAKKDAEKKEKKSHNAMKRAEKKAQREAKKASKFVKKLLGEDGKKSAQKDDVEVIIDNPKDNFEKLNLNVDSDSETSDYVSEELDINEDE